MISLCNNWEFTETWTDAFAAGEGEAAAVRLPHTVRLSPLHYALPSDYEMICGYRRRVTRPADTAGKHIFLQFDGAAHIATVYLNGTEIASHCCGYTAFRAEITDLLRPGEEGLLTVKLDSTENAAVPPFGFMIDYLTYGGLYREVWMDIRGESFLEDVYLTTPGLDRLNAEFTIRGDSRKVRLSVWDGETCLASAVGEDTFSIRVPGVKPWNAEDPKRYLCRAELLDSENRTIDCRETMIGFRTIAFRKDGFYLNGKKFFLRGLNRHQSYPYIGYAAPESLQREDARILKEELGCTAVRTSHYPQSQYFIDECDRLGLLVFTEIPGWQHIGDEAWKKQAVENTREMVLQYRNHPSIVLWGVRINESQDDDALYTETNAVAHALDPSRPTSGVRFIEQSSLLEDVYAFNDFSHTGDNEPNLPKKRVTPDPEKAFLISEHNGHMFPTKSYDNWSRRQEHALRHTRVQNGAASSGEHAGCFGWCMFDYPTHKDFGSGDRVCYHGVMDAFRNPKLAAAVYASQGERPVLEIGSSMDIGDYPAGNIGKIYAFTNADAVELYKNDKFVARFSESEWKGLPHGPIEINDTIGGLLNLEEGFTGAKERILKSALQAAAIYGLAALPAAERLKLGYCMVRYGMTMAQGVELYGKYISNWGGEATVWRFDAVKDGQVVASTIRSPGSRLHLEAKASSQVLTEGDTYDMAAIRLRILDEYGNIAHYAQLPLQFEVNGDVELVGPSVVTAEGGMSGTYVKSRGRAGTGSITIKVDGCAPAELHFDVREA